MPDITNEILGINRDDPLNSPICPTVEDILDYEEDLDKWRNEVTYEWATNEIKGHLMNWVRVGLTAYRVRLYRLYKKRYPDWKTYCKEVLGKTSWHINKIIEGAKATLDLIRAGFTVLPTCAAQAMKLVDCCKKTHQYFADAWEQVLIEFPAAHLITANSIGVALGFPSEKSQIRVPRELGDRLRRKALDMGMSVKEMLQDFVSEDEVVEDESTEENDETEFVGPDKIEAWEQDLEDLVREHDSQFWLLLNLVRFILPIPRIET